MGNHNSSFILGRLNVEGVNSLVSIIIPVYNAEKHIKDLLFSIERQVYRPLEVILIDDGSTDRSVQFIEEVMQVCSFQTKLILQENQGVSAARNVGLNEAAGEYIVFVDADDLLSPYYIQFMYDDIRGLNASMVICGFDYFVDSNKLRDSHDVHSEVIDSKKMMDNFLLGKIKISICSLMVKRDIINHYGLKFAVGCKYGEDIHFVWKLLIHSDLIIYNSTILYYYRIHPESAMAKVNESRLDGFLLMKDLELYFQEYCMEFAPKFQKYGVARWVWAALWQFACATPYKKFKEICELMNAQEMMAKLQDFPDAYVRLSARMFLWSKALYYNSIRFLAKNHTVGKLKHH